MTLPILFSVAKTVTEFYFFTRKQPSAMLYSVWLFNGNIFFSAIIIARSNNHKQTAHVCRQSKIVCLLPPFKVNIPQFNNRFKAVRLLVLLAISASASPIVMRCICEPNAPITSSYRSQLFTPSASRA